MSSYDTSKMNNWDVYVRRRKARPIRYCRTRQELM